MTSSSLLKNCHADDLPGKVEGHGFIIYRGDQKHGGGAMDLAPYVNSVREEVCGW